MSPDGLDPAFRPAASLLRALDGELVRVGTRNPAKLGAVRAGVGCFAAAPSAIRLEAVDADSGVSEQPIGWDAIVSGARNRARAALGSGACAFAVGIEDGLVRLADAPGEAADVEGVYNVGCAWISDGEREGHGFSSAFRYPRSAWRPPCARGRRSASSSTRSGGPAARPRDRQPASHPAVRAAISAS